MRINWTKKGKKIRKKKRGRKAYWDSVKAKYKKKKGSKK